MQFYLSYLSSVGEAIMKMHILNKKAFTLMEIMIVVIIMGVMVAFALPQYNKTVDRARLQDGVNQLTAIHSAMLIYRAQKGTILAGTNLTVTDLNEALGINIISNGLTYDYDALNVAAGDYQATAIWGGKTLTLTEDPISYPTNPTCTPSAGACP